MGYFTKIGEIFGEIKNKIQSGYTRTVMRYRQDLSSVAK
jgi:hypothetical protein